MTGTRNNGSRAEPRSRDRAALSAKSPCYHCGWPLASPDPDIRREASESLSQGFRAARALNAHCVGVSVIANGPEEGDLWSDEVWHRLVQGMAEVMAEAENLGVDLGVHPGNRGPLDAPAQLRRLLDDVASPRLKVIFDPVNMTTPPNLLQYHGLPRLRLRFAGPGHYRGPRQRCVFGYFPLGDQTRRGAPRDGSARLRDLSETLGWNWTKTCCSP